jgi:PknH-like extracellular domain
MKTVARIAVPLLAVTLAAGCTRVVDGAPHPAPGMTPRPLTGRVVNRVLLDDGELSKMLDQPFKTDPNSPSRFGGIELLSDGNASPRECTAPAIELPKSAFEGSDVRQVAKESWWNAASYDENPRVISVHEAVVALPTAAAADPLFAKFTEQWRHCDGTTVSMGDGYFTMAISDVSGANSVVAASVRVHGSTTVPNARAVGVRVNCLVEVRVAFFDLESGRSAHDDKTVAVNIAHRMMDKISELS